jgi:F-type H+-transporting ATPase subunit gamma
MAIGKEIRNKIKSIQNTQKITKAMEMVATSKMRKAQQRMRAARPYAMKVRNVIAHLAHAHTEYRHPYLIHRQVRRVGYVIVSTDRGLCGGLNINLFKEVIRSMKEWQDQGAEIDLCLIGNKALGFFKRMGGNIVAQTSRLGDAPSPDALISAVNVMLIAYMEGRIDQLYLARNEFVNTMLQKPRVLPLIPATDAIAIDKIDEEITSRRWDYLYEPDSRELLHLLFDRYIESLVYHGVIENIACEMSARTIAMKSASENAGNIIDELQLAYNKARQAAITTELADIVGGAAAV